MCLCFAGLYGRMTPARIACAVPEPEPAPDDPILESTTMCSVSMRSFLIRGASAKMEVTAMHPGQETSCAFLIFSLCSSGTPKTDLDR